VETSLCQKKTSVPHGSAAIHKKKMTHGEKTQGKGGRGYSGKKKTVEELRKKEKERLPRQPPRHSSRPSGVTKGREGKATMPRCEKKRRWMGVSTRT